MGEKREGEKGKKREKKNKKSGDKHHKKINNTVIKQKTTKHKKIQITPQWGQNQKKNKKYCNKSQQYPTIDGGPSGSKKPGW